MSIGAPAGERNAARRRREGSPARGFPAWRVDARAAILTSMRDSNEPRLSVGALGAALVVVTVWGFNFTVVKLGLADVPPLFLLTLRFAFCAFPAVLFVPKPAASWGSLTAYGLLLGLGQFGLLFTALKLGAPAGLSSVLLQSQAFFTALLAAAVLRERIRLYSVLGMALAAAGLALVALSGRGGSLSGMTVPLALMILGAAFFWGAANVVVRTMPGADALGLVVWSSVVSPLPLLGLSLWLEGPGPVAASLARPTLAWIGAVAYLVIAASLVGYGLWNRLILRYGAGRIAPFSLLVPIVGISSAALVLGERFGPADAAATALVLAGLLVHVFGGSLAGRLKRWTRS